MRRLLLGLALFIGCAGLARAWFAEGHMVVAQLAYNHLNPGVKTACDNLMAVSLAPFDNPDENTFVTSAVWADTFKASLHSSNAHFFNLPFSLDSSSTATAWANSLANSQDIVRAIRQCIALLQSSTASQKDKAQALRYLIHYVGDAHQPLHGVTNVTNTHPTGDLGGNSFALTYNDGTSVLTNLHALWDAGAGSVDHGINPPLNGGTQTTIDNIVADIEATYPYAANIGSVPNPMDWVEEDLFYSRTVAYIGITTGSTPNASYIDNTTATCKLRLAQGGHRLADLLNTIMAASSDVATLDVTEPEIETAENQSTTLPNQLAIDASGNMITWETVGTPRLVRMEQDGTSGTTIVTRANIINALIANNSSVLPTTFPPLAIRVAADGDIVVLGRINGTNEALISVPNQPNQTEFDVTVIALPAFSVTNPIDGATDFVLSGNRAYIAEDTSQQATVTNDQIIMLDTNDASVPFPTITIVATETALNAPLSLATHALHPGPIVLNPLTGKLWLCDSAATGATDSWIEVTTSTTSPSAALKVSKASVVSDLQSPQGYTVTDLGFVGATFSASGNLYCLNQNGDGTADDSIIEIAAPGTGSQAIYIRNLAQVQIDTGGDGTWSSFNTFGGSIGSEGIAQNSVNGRMYTVVSTSVGSKGIMSLSTFAALPVELAGFSAE